MTQYSCSTEISKEVGNCLHWLTNNRISMHMGKTDTFEFSSKPKSNLTKNLFYKMSGT